MKHEDYEYIRTNWTGPVQDLDSIVSHPRVPAAPGNWTLASESMTTMVQRASEGGPRYSATVVLLTWLWRAPKCR